MTFVAFGEKGKLKMNPHTRKSFAHFLNKNDGMRLEINPVLPESDRMRGYFEGALIPLITFYQEGMDHRSGEDRAQVREWIKLEFNAKMISIKGETKKVGKSTKGREVLKAVVERVLDWLVQNYAAPTEAINSEAYKEWRDTAFPAGGPDNYIDYLVEVGVLKESI